MRESTVDSLAAAGGGSIVGSGGVRVRGVTHDSARVLPGWLFCCIRGSRSDGHDFADAAVAGGATALLTDHALELDVAQIVVDDTRAAMGPVAAAFWGRPSFGEVDVVGVTGTNGKTTVVTLVEQILDSAGRRCEVIGTLTGPRTTPEATDLQSQLRGFVDPGIDTVAMEVSSHALELHRVDGTHFRVAVFTNLGTDHLDFHGTPERYFEAKAKLFDSARADIAVVNLDDVHGRLLRDATEIETVGYSLDQLDDLQIGPLGSSFVWRGQRVTVPIAGRFNVSNMLAAAETCVLLGVEPELVARAAPDLRPPAGRFELIDAGQPFTVVVDYAHTPEGLSNLLDAARELVRAGRVHLVFGCGGDRERSKRPAMGAVACELADEVVITSDNPRSEDPEAIISAVRAGCGRDVVTEVDRRAAIALSLSAATAGDVVVIAGKGHETTQITGGHVDSFDDRVVAVEELEALGFGPLSGARR